MTAKAAVRTSTKRGVTGLGSHTPATFIEQDWQRTKSILDEDADLEWATAEMDEKVEQWECVACGKTFRSEASWSSHERSKKHMQAVNELRRQMLDDEETLELGASLADDGDEILTAEGVFLPSRVLPEPNISDKKATENAENLPQEDRTPTRQKKKTDPRPSSPNITETERQGKGRLLNKQIDDDIATDTPRLQEQIARGDMSEPQDESKAASYNSGNTVQMSKRDKRRAREAAKKTKAESEDAKLVCTKSVMKFTSLIAHQTQTCNVCKQAFSSRTQLFTHIHSTGHSRADDGDERNARVKGKRSKR